MKIDFRKSHKCFYCDVSVEGGEEYTLKYQAQDGEAELKMCVDCAKDMNEMLMNIEEIQNAKG